MTETALQITPLHDWHAAHGGRLVDFAGWHMPVKYTGIIPEHLAVRSQAGLFDISHMGRLWLPTLDGVDALSSLLTVNVAALLPGQVRYALICQEDGGIIDDVLVTRLPSSVLVVVNASNRQAVLEWIVQQSSALAHQLIDLTISHAMIAVQGPLAADLLPSSWRNEYLRLKYYSAIELQPFGSNQGVVLSRTGYTGEDGFELIAPADRITQFWQDMLRLGETRGAVPAGLGCRDTLRLEAAMPLYGHELTRVIDPITAGLKFAVQLQNHPFIGKEALAQRANAACQQLARVGLVLYSRRIAREGTPVLADGLNAGMVTSGTFSPSLRQSIAMAYLQPTVASTGHSVQVDLRGKLESATVVPLPFYRRKK